MSATEPLVKISNLEIDGIADEDPHPHHQQCQP